MSKEPLDIITLFGHYTGGDIINLVLGGFIAGIGAYSLLRLYKQTVPILLLHGLLCACYTAAIWINLGSLPGLVDHATLSSHFAYALQIIIATERVLRCLGGQGKTIMYCRAALLATFPVLYGFSWNNHGLITLLQAFMASGICLLLIIVMAKTAYSHRDTSLYTILVAATLVFGTLLAYDATLMQWLSQDWLATPLYPAIHGVALLLLAHDINCRLAPKRTRAHRSQRDFIHHLCHEIRTPVACALGNIELLSRTVLDMDQRDLLKAVKSSCESLNRLAYDVLNHANAYQQQFVIEHVAFDLRQLCNTILDQLEPVAAGKSLELDCYVAKSVPDILVGDPERLKQILGNLLYNSIKFTGKGKILLIVSKHPVPDNKTRIRFEVADSGSGIAENRLDTLFSTSIHNNSPEHDSYGLGLGICKKLVEDMQGEIGVASIENQGSTFWFTLDFNLPEKDLSNELFERQEDSFVSKVLVIDDCPANCLATRKLLEAKKHIVTTADSAKTALNIINRRHFDLAIVDIHLPDMDGKELIRQLKAMGRKNMLIVTLTALLTEENTKVFSNCGADFSMEKPLDINKLQAFMRHHKSRGKMLLQA